MARLAIGTVLGLIVGTTTVTAHAADDTEPTQAVIDTARDANVEVPDLQGALNTLQEAYGAPVDPREYAYSVGLLQRPYAPPSEPAGWPIGGALGQRIYCIEAIESHHGVAMWNPTPVGHEHASGWLGFLPSTARSVGVIIGDRASEWNGAARMLATGRGAEFAGVAMRIC